MLEEEYAELHHGPSMLMERIRPRGNLMYATWAMMSRVDTSNTLYIYASK